jgi:hypothetical protein
LFRTDWIVLALAVGAPALPQAFRFGLKAGVPLTAYFETGRAASRVSSAEYSAATRRYTVGLSVERPFAGPLGFEFDALYRRMGYVGTVSFFSGPSGLLTTSVFDAKGQSWDFPLLAKYRFGRVLRPYLTAGPVLRYIGPIRARGEVIVENLITRAVTRTPLDTAEPSDLRKRFYPGLAAAGGVEFGLRRIRFLPEIRCTRWTANISRSGGLLRFPSNQLEFLLGILF